MDVLGRVLGDSKLLVHVLVCVFAVSSWVDINGMWVELPIFVTHLPEQWTLPSYIIILSQIANIGPIIFFIFAHCLPRTSTSLSRLTLDKVTSYLIMLVGVTATFLMAFLWQHTRYLAGSERSVALLALSFFLSLMDCTSSMAYVAFMAALKPLYLPSFFVGEGLSGLLPAMMALGQGSGDIVCKNGSSTEEKNVSDVLVNVTTYYEYPVYLPPRFSVQLFFLLLSGMIVMSMVAFCLINNLPYCKHEFVAVSTYSLTTTATSGEKSGGGSKLEGPVGICNPACSVDVHNAVMGGRFSVITDGVGERPVPDPLSPRPDCVSSVNGSYGSTDTVAPGRSPRRDGEERVLTEEEEGEMSTGKILLLLTQVVVINFLITSFLLSIQTYSCLPYGIYFYNLVVTLTNIANPVASLVSLFLAVKSLLAITSLTAVGVACGAYIIVLATMSPEPPLVGQSSGGPVAVAVWVGASFFLTYAKVSVAGILRHVGRRALIWYGAATQVGAFIGAVTGFVLVNEVKLFKDASWC